MMLILNRLRGTHGYFAIINGVVLGLLTYVCFGDVYVASIVAVGYVLGESFGWGEWVGTLTGDRNFKQLNEEGKNNGIQWLASKVIDPSKDWINYCRVALTIRGFYWWLPTLAPLYFVGFSVVSITVAVAVLSIGFPLACELGRLTAPLFSFEYKTFSIKGGWEHSEVWYGLMQDLVLIGLGVSYVMAH